MEEKKKPEIIVTIDPKTGLTRIEGSEEDKQAILSKYMENNPSARASSENARQFLSNHPKAIQVKATFINVNAKKTAVIEWKEGRKSLYTNADNIEVKPD